MHLYLVENTHLSASLTTPSRLELACSSASEKMAIIVSRYSFNLDQNSSLVQAAPSIGLSVMFDSTAAATDHPRLAPVHYHNHDSDSIIDLLYFYFVRNSVSLLLQRYNCQWFAPYY